MKFERKGCSHVQNLDTSHLELPAVTAMGGYCTNEPAKSHLAAKPYCGALKG